MKVQLASRLIHNLLDTLQGAGIDCPLVRDGGQLFVQYDNIAVTLLGRSVQVKFYWRGEVVAELPIDGAIRLGDTLHLEGLTGRMGLELV